MTETEPRCAQIVCSVLQEVIMGAAEHVYPGSREVEVATEGLARTVRHGLDGWEMEFRCPVEDGLCTFSFKVCEGPPLLPPTIPETTTICLRAMMLRELFDYLYEETLGKRPPEDLD